MRGIHERGDPYCVFRCFYRSSRRERGAPSHWGVATPARGDDLANEQRALGAESVGRAESVLALVGAGARAHPRASHVFVPTM
jgi:hypothetical protein